MNIRFKRYSSQLALRDRWHTVSAPRAVSASPARSPRVTEHNRGGLLAPRLSNALYLSIRKHKLISLSYFSKEIQMKPPSNVVSAFICSGREGLPTTWGSCRLQIHRVGERARERRGGKWRGLNKNKQR